MKHNKFWLQFGFVVNLLLGAVNVALGNTFLGSCSLSVAAWSWWDWYETEKVMRQDNL